MNITEWARKNNLNELLSDTELIQSFLLKEYGYILPKFEKITHVEVKEINLLDLKFHEERMQLVMEENLDDYRAVFDPVIVYLPESRLIDGYHRVALALKNKKSSIMAFVIS